MPFKLFEIKSLAQMFNGAQVEIYGKKDALGTVQMNFLRSILAAPNGTTNAE